MERNNSKLKISLKRVMIHVLKGSGVQIGLIFFGYFTSIILTNEWIKFRDLQTYIWPLILSVTFYILIVTGVCIILKVRKTYPYWAIAYNESGSFTIAVPKILKNNRK